MPASAWVFQFSAAVPQNPTQAGTGWYFDFPADCAIDPTLGYRPCSVNYLVTGFGGAIESPALVSITVAKRAHRAAAVGRARGFCRCEFGVVHSGRERTYQDDRIELATPRIECQKPMSIGENPGPPIVHKPPERSIALLCHLREAPIGPAINGGDTPWSMGLNLLPSFLAL